MNGENVSTPKTNCCSNGKTSEKTNCCCSNCNCPNVLLPALVITIIGTVFGFLTCGWLFKWIYAIEPISAWKYGLDVAPSVKAMAVNFVGEFILSMILVCVFMKLYDGIPYSGWKKGVKFGFLVWLVSALPGMFAIYMWMNVAVEWIAYMTIMGLVVLLIKGAVIGAMCKK
ncbi:DUF1761 domain-containing protein [Patescibacteria group bacterium]|nr:DUF1761 domain-containing protein [Patescibacteria group bacterium]